MDERSLLRPWWTVHRALFRLSGGRIGTIAPGKRRLGVLFLETTGHRTGRRRTNALYYIDAGADLAVVASNAGNDRDPGWLANLRAHPEATVWLGREQVRVRARRATPEEEAALWPRLDAGYSRFAVYRRRAARPIPIVILVRS